MQDSVRGIARVHGQEGVGQVRGRVGEMVLVRQ